RPADFDAWRSTEPVQQARTLASTAILLDDERVFITAFVAAEPEVRQELFPLLTLSTCGGLARRAGPRGPRRAAAWRRRRPFLYRRRGGALLCRGRRFGGC